MRTFNPDHHRDAWDQLWCEMRCGRVKPGEIVRVWDAPFEGDYRDCRYVTGRAEFFGGQPSLKEIRK